MKGLVLLAALLLQPDFALAHGDEKPKHGGIMGRGDETVTVEFVFKQGVVEVYVEDHDSATPIPGHDLGGAWLSVSGSGRLPYEVKLVPSGENRLTASGLQPARGRPAECAPHPAERHGNVVDRDFPRRPALEWPE